MIQGKSMKRSLLLICILISSLFICGCAAHNSNTDIQTQGPINLSQAKITAPEAILIASDQYSNVTVIDASAILYIQKIGSKQQLVWDVYLDMKSSDHTGYIPKINATDNTSMASDWMWGGIVTVDAITGKVLQVNQEV
jgi:hypothetical protein